MKRPSGFDGGGFESEGPDDASLGDTPPPSARRAGSGRRRAVQSERPEAGTAADPGIEPTPERRAERGAASPAPEESVVASEAVVGRERRRGVFAVQRRGRGDHDPPEPRSGDRVREAERVLAQARDSVRRRERRETRRFTAHLRRRRRSWLVVAGAVLALALFVAVGTLSPLTAVREVQISGASRVSVEKLQTALGRFEGVPLTLVRDREVHRALEPFPLIQRYSIERIPPHTLVVRIEERDPVIAIGHDSRYQLLDPAGVLVATADEAPAGIPLAEGAAADPGSPAFAATASVIRDLPKDIRDRLVGVTATSAQDVEFILARGLRVVWGEAADTQRKAAVLRAMLKSVPRASVIDVSAPDAPVFE